MSRTRRALRSALATCLVAAVVMPIAGSQAATAATLPTGFQEQVVFSGLTDPTNIEFAPDGRIFVAEKGGKIVGGNALQPTATATSIRDDVVTDGPFAETKEALGGYYLIEARDLDHALDIAKLCPAPYGGVEVRPIMDVSGSM